MQDDKVMPFMEHLAELRRRLLWAVFALLVGMAVAWNFSQLSLNFIERPLTGHTYLAELKGSLYTALKGRFPALYQRYESHLEKAPPPPSEQRKLNYSAPLEPFFVQIKISLIGGIILALPIILYQLWLFVAPGLTTRERRFALPFITAGTLSFLLGAGFFLLVIWPVVINFSLSYESEGLRSWLNLTAYVDFCLRLLLIFGVVFELPVVVSILARLGFVTSRFLARQRKYALLVSAIIAAFHADLLTMAVIWIPLYLMYEVGIWGARIFGTREENAGAGVQASAA